MSGVDRRTFIKRSAAGVAGAAAIGALGAGPAAAATRLASRDGGDTEPESASGDAVVAYIRPGTREVRVMVGDREVVHRDADLARRILRAAK
jgi:anaerobic selenocysteine-containing dehydrogenase